MESYSKFLNLLYNLLTPESVTLVLVIIFIFVPSLVTFSRNKKSPNKIQCFSWLPFSAYALRGLFRISNVPICEVFMKMGSFVSFPFYSSPAIVISNDFQLIKQILNSDEWIDRPKNALAAFMNSGHQDRGIVFSRGKAWKESRRFTVRTLGLSKRNNLENIINEELNGLLEHAGDKIQKTNNIVQMRGFFSLAVVNVIWRIIGGNGFSPHNPDFVEIVDATNTITEASIFQLFLGESLGSTVLKSVPGLFRLRTLVDANQTMRRHFTNVLERHQQPTKEKQGGDEFQNFSDHFLRLMESKENIGNDKMKQVFNNENLISILFDLFLAGVETTRSALEFAVMFLATRPEIQEKIRNEIKTVIGDKEPSFLSDRANMPYTQAIIYEVNRMASKADPIIYRSTVRDCHVNNTFIRKGTVAFINAYSIHYNEEIWMDPCNFRPERFLTEEGQLDNSKLRRILSFGGGKRSCVGESVANFSLFTFLVGILQKYELQKANPNEVWGMKINSSLTNRLKPFHVHFVKT